MKYSRKWIYIRCVMLLLFCVGGWFSVSWWHLGYLDAWLVKFHYEIAAFSTFATFVIVSLLVLTYWNPKEELRAPSWRRNPFERGQILVGVHAGALNAIFYGIGCLAKERIFFPSHSFWQLPLFVGVGMWIGVRGCTIVFRRILGHPPN